MSRFNDPQKKGLSRFCPRSLSGQLILSLLLALIVAQVMSFIILADERHLAIASAERGQVVARTASIARVLEQTPPRLHHQVVDAASTWQLSFTIDEDSIVDPSVTLHAENIFARRLRDLLEKEKGDVLVVVEENDMWNWSRDNDEFEGERHWRHDDDDYDYDDDDDDDDDDQYETYGDGRNYGNDLRSKWAQHRHALNLSLSVRLADSGWLNADYRVFGPPRGWARGTFLTVGLAGIGVCLVTFLMLRRLTRPLKKLADAAETLGRGEETGALDETGPMEIRRTTAAFNQMKDRLRRFVDDRTRMLAAISHDLRTPLTTLRLRAEMLEDGEAKQKILETLDEMQRMTEATMAFAREDATREETRVVDLSSLVESIILDQQDLGNDVIFDKPAPLSYRCRPFSLKRAIRNLIENAIRYGDSATIQVESFPDRISIIIEDSGPGIPEENHDRMFQPFVRMEESRSQETGGIGLGLSIARTIIRAHGGDITLSNRAAGGLRVQVDLPPVTSSGSEK